MTALAVGLIVMSLGMPIGDLADDLEAGEQFDFEARQLVVSWTDDGVLADVGSVVQADGMVMSSYNSDMFMLGDGRAIRRDSGGMRYVEAPTSSPWRLFDGYEVEMGEEDPRLAGARVVEVLEAGSVRARFLIDEESDLALVTEAYGADGSLYRYAALLSVQPGVSGDYAMPDMASMPEPDVMEEAVAETLPSLAGHYWQADAYSAPNGVQAFFTDGLFSFSVFELARRTDIAEMESARRIEIAGEEYLRGYSPTSVSVFWRAPDHSYLLVGDLPPDHLEEVLRDLPSPGRAGLAKRLWRSIFG